MNSLNKDEKINELIGYVKEGGAYYIMLIKNIGDMLFGKSEYDEDFGIKNELFNEDIDNWDFDDDSLRDMAENVYMHWSKAWKLFKEFMKKDESGLFNIDVDFEQWMNDFVFVLKILVRKDKKYAEIAEEVLNYLIKYLSVNEESKLIYLYELGHLYYIIGEYKKAEVIYKEVIDKLPDYPMIYIEYAQLLIDTDRFRDAEKIMEKCFENCKIVDSGVLCAVIGGIYANLKEKGRNQISEKLRDYYNLRDKVTETIDKLSNNIDTERFKKSIDILEIPVKNKTLLADEEELAILINFMIFESIDGVRIIDNVDESKYDNEILDALKKSKYSLFKVIFTNPKEHILEIEDVIENKRYTVMDVMLSKTVDVGYLFTSRYVPFENYGVILTSGYVFSPKSKATLLKKFKKLMKKLNYEDEETKKFIVLHKLGKRYGDLMTALW